MARDRRCDFSRVDAATARRLLASYRPVVRALCGLYSSDIRDDLLSIGDEAILEGFLSLQPERATESGWIRRVIHWRLTEAARTALCVPVTVSLEDGSTADNHDTEREVLQNLALRVVGLLSPRHQAIILGRLQAETLEEIAQSLGISTARTQVEERNALILLRKAMEKR